MKDFILNAIKEGLDKYDLNVFTTPELEQLISNIDDYRTEMGRLSDTQNVKDLYDQTYALLKERRTKDYDSHLYVCQLSDGEQSTLRNAIVDVFKAEFGVDSTDIAVDTGNPGKPETIDELLDKAMSGKLTDLSDTLDWRAALKGYNYYLDDRMQDLD